MNNLKFPFLSILIILLLLISPISYSQYVPYVSLEMISNGNGVINNVVGFDITTPPTGYGAYSADWYRDVIEGAGSIRFLPNGMQAAGGWYFIVAGDNTVTGYDWAMNRWTRNGFNANRVLGNTYEIRFTPAGGKALMYFTSRTLVDVPFEIWLVDTNPNGTDNSVRMIPWINDDDGNDLFNFKLDHFADGGNNDPYSDWMYFVLPNDISPGQSGYNQFVQDVINGTYNPDLGGQEHVARFVLMNWDQHQYESSTGAGDGPVGAMPENGTIFRMSFEPLGLQVDIKPGKEPNSINIDNPKQIISVAVLTTDYFDATQIDPSTVTFGPNKAQEIRNSSSIKDVDGDGDLDMIFNFRNSDTGLQITDQEATIEGVTIYGRRFFGTDAIKCVNLNTSWAGCDNTIDDPGVHDRNKVKLLVSPDGQIAYNGDLEGKGFFPSNTCNQYIYAAGPSIGGLVNGVPVVAHAVYNSEFVPSEIGNTGDLFRVFNSSLPQDKKSWPPEFSASNGKPIIVTDAQNLVVQYNDLEGTPHGDQLIPLGVEVRQRSLAFGTKEIQNAIIFIWEITNISGQSIDDVFFGYWCDADIGNLNIANDDRASLVNDMAITWDSYFMETNFKGKPGIVGFAFLETLDNRGVQNFSVFTNPGDNGDPFRDIWQYYFLSGNFHYESNVVTDIRMLLSTSLLSLNPGQSRTIAGALIFGTVPDGTTYLATHPEFPFRPDPSDPILADILNTRDIVQQFYDQNLRGMSLPKSNNNSEKKVVQEIPNNFILNQNYPNPFNPSTTIRYGLPSESRVTVKIINILGQEVTTLVNSTQSAGYHQVNFNAGDLPSGIYFYRISAESLDGKTNFVDTKKLMLMK